MSDHPCTSAKGTVEDTTKDLADRDRRNARIAAEPMLAVGDSTGFFRGTVASIQAIWAYRELLGRLVKREIKVRYKDSSLGLIWSLFRPLIQLLIYYFAIGQVLGAARSTPDFGIFVFIGLTFWMLYSEIISGATTSILGNSGLIKKVYLPREIFPLSTVGSALVNFAIQTGVLLLGVALLSHFRVSWELLYAPAAIVLVVLVSTGLGLMLAAFNVYLRDVQHFVDIYIIVFFWLSPIVYPYTLVHSALGDGWLQELYLANPISIAIIAAQKALWPAGSEPSAGQVWPDHLELRVGFAIILGLLLTWIGQRVFSRLQGNFAQEM